MKAKISRRKFLEISALATAGVTLGLSNPRDGQAESPNDIINVGIIGVGDRGEWEAYILKDIPGMRVIACCDILPDHLANGLKQADTGAKGYQDYRNLLENKDIDAVVIATPLHLHYQMAMDALQADKHIYCEKTMTYNIEQAHQLTEAVTRFDRVFQVGYQTRNNPLIGEIRKMIRSGACGQITHIRCNYHRNGDWRREVPDPQLERLINWRMYWEYSGGLMAELCSHHIDIANWFLESHPEKVTGFGGIDYWKDGRETFDNVCTIYEYPEGIKAIFTSITTNAHYGISLQYMGTRGTIEINNEEGQQALYFAEQKFVEEEPVPEKEGSAYAVTSATYQAWKRGEGVPIKVENQPQNDRETTGLALLHFGNCIRNNKIPVSNAKTARDAAVAVHLGNRAMRNGTIEYFDNKNANQHFPHRSIE
ncbi:MAG: Gfo/Idh/MocA family oxidoreductase [Aliifodinibius sp.]|nr:Gfo/Idh/MocA family oxidoreductase [candidate division Zixibacteria bacterium]NIT61268.1 Gfo/Idh/MocA family oxidoreductase [Fodinibius sp.]NIS48686.1 Gfo/Idh/MocA family oxidoreductase [candidate division Zixibacteria bacterium]NIU16757.1 Gfo/Idh/MocA family oxidoreductase [candidate division Zixibacteria bacterium]NIV08918.1 Gfo/Idh/MocA family oxidoreductase [candidate division Zixibacteria bacterium]